MDRAMRPRKVAGSAQARASLGMPVRARDTEAQAWNSGTTGMISVVSAPAATSSIDREMPNPMKVFGVVPRAAVFAVPELIRTLEVPRPAGMLKHLASLRLCRSDEA